MLGWQGDVESGEGVTGMQRVIVKKRNANRGVGVPGKIKCRIREE